jgi:ABC-type nitrate/sulfonate/bicarbonate transport system permease component
MTSTPAVGGPAGAGGSTRRAAAGLLLTAWAVAVTASYLGDPAHELAPKLVTAFLLWRIWRGASWSRNLLIGLSCVSAGFAVGLAVAIALGATGIVTSALVMFALYAGVGVLLCTPPVRGLARSPRTMIA